MRQGRRLGQYRFRCQNGRSNRGTRYGLVQRFIDIGNQSPPPSKGIPVRVRLRPAGLLQGIIKAAHKMVASVGALRHVSDRVIYSNLQPSLISAHPPSYYYHILEQPANPMPRGTGTRRPIAFYSRFINDANPDAGPDFSFPAFDQVGEKTEALFVGLIVFEWHAANRSRVAVPRVVRHPIACWRCRRRLRENRSSFRERWNVYRCRSRPQQIQIFGRLFQDRPGDLRRTKSESRLQRTVTKAVYQTRDPVRVFKDQVDHVPGEQALLGQTCPRDPVMEVFFEVLNGQRLQTADATNPLLQLPQFRTPQDFAQFRLSSHNDLQQFLAWGFQIQQ